MLNSVEKFYASRDKKNKYSNSCVVRKKKFWTKQYTITPPHFKFNGRFLTSISSWFFHTTFKDLTEQILYPKWNRMYHFASFWKTIFWGVGANPRPLTAFSLSRVGMYVYIWLTSLKEIQTQFLSPRLFVHVPQYS